MLNLGPFRQLLDDPKPYSSRRKVLKVSYLNLCELYISACQNMYSYEVQYWSCVLLLHKVERSIPGLPDTDNLIDLLEPNSSS